MGFFRRDAHDLPRESGKALGMWAALARAVQPQATAKTVLVVTHERKNNGTRHS